MADDAAKKPRPAGPSFGARILPYLLVWIAMSYGRDLLAGPAKDAAKDASGAPAAPDAMAAPAYARDAVDEEFADLPAAAAPAKAAAPAEPVPAAPARRRAAAGETADVLVRLCTSWGTQRNYLNLRQFLEDAYPQVRSVHAEQYPPPAAGVFAQQIAGIAQIALVVLFLGGEKVFQVAGAPTPAWFPAIMENKMMTFGCVWMANNVAASMVATGAFEIVVNGELVYSKLETGRLPGAAEIVEGLARLGFESEKAQTYLR